MNGGKMNSRAQRVFRAVKLSHTYYNGGHISLYICQNPQNVQHQECLGVKIQDVCYLLSYGSYRIIIICMYIYMFTCNTCDIYIYIHI